MQRISLDQLRLSPQHHFFGINHLDDLAERMQAHGLVEPIVVRRVEDYFEIVDGRRRCWAARQLGWRSIDANVINNISYA